jgi:hypothetical protein
MTAYIITAIFEGTGERYVASGSWIYREEAETILPLIADLVGLTDVRIESVESFW